MNNPYDVHSWSKLYREERLAEASRRHLTEHLRASREPRELRSLRSAWRGVLASLGVTSDDRDRLHTELVK